MTNVVLQFASRVFASVQAIVCQLQRGWCVFYAQSRQLSAGGRISGTIESQTEDKHAKCRVSG